MAGVTLKDVRKVYTGGVEAVKGVNVTIPDGHFCVLVGPSGCGKSTLLRMIAGLETVTSGEVRIGDEVVNDIEPADRDIAMVFQNYALYPHMNVYDNLAYGLRNRGTPKDEIEARVREAARILEIDALLARKPRQLSGGQRQRVAMGRAIVRKPKAFLFDEPLSNLDAKLRVSMRVEIRKLQRSLATTSIYVTHDQLEAMTLADMLVVMNAGQVEQIGPPLAVYEKPATTFVAAFIGAPPMNLLKMTAGEAAASVNGAAISLPAEGAIVGVRPEDLSLSRDGSRPQGGVAFDLTVSAVERVGPETFVYASPAQGGDMIVRMPGQAAPATGERITAVAPPEKLHVFSADGRRRLDA
ncbi:MAG TPA: sn-glycerol-3-phosphate import ATP-binding protein UgpC [Pseudorhodoplanes sp.]|jgi:sn-glycerol 3-phosphate transport system ATP-binding protein|nr:sn-glycerol-3-phosphate import ATP-binding protein UgpC [Pseudorhodoplanes sp.]